MHEFKPQYEYRLKHEYTFQSMKTVQRINKAQSIYKQYNVHEYTMLEESILIAILLGGSQAAYFTLQIKLTGIKDCTMLVLLIKVTYRSDSRYIYM